VPSFRQPRLGPVGFALLGTFLEAIVFPIVRDRPLSNTTEKFDVPHRSRTFRDSPDSEDHRQTVSQFSLVSDPRPGGGLIC